MRHSRSPRGTRSRSPARAGACSRSPRIRRTTAGVSSSSARSRCVVPRRAHARSPPAARPKRPGAPRPDSRVRGRGPMYVSMFDIDEALRYLIVHEGSDLHLKVPTHPIVRIHGEMVPIKGSEPLKAEDTERILREILHDPNKLGEFEAENEVDFSYQIEGL